MGKRTKNLVWRRSSYCDAVSCVEVARTRDAVLVRDSKCPDAGTLAFTPAEWAVFIRAARNSEFDFA